MDGLTKSQEKVLILATAGRTNQQIARELGIATSTVKAHMNAILTRLEVPNRTAAVAIYMRSLRAHDQPVVQDEYAGRLHRLTGALQAHQRVLADAEAHLRGVGR